MKVLHINSNYLTSELHENLVKEISKKGYLNAIYMPIKKETLDDFKYVSKFEVFSPVTFTSSDKFLFTWKQHKIINKLKNHYTVTEYDLVHAHTLFTDGNVAYELNKRYGLPYVVTVRGDTDLYNFVKIRVNLRSKGRMILKNASSIIFLSEIHRKFLLDNYIHSKKLKEYILANSYIIPNGIDDFWFANQSEPKHLSDRNKLKIISIGQIMKRKNQNTLIKAIELLRITHNINISLTLIGKIVEPEYFKQLKIDNYDFINHFHYMSKENLLHYYKTHDIFALTSTRETFGLVYPEAMSQGLPVIYSKGQGFYSQFDEGLVGYGVDPLDVKEIADSIMKIIKNFNNFSYNAIENYKEFEWSKIAERITAIYDDAF